MADVPNANLYRCPCENIAVYEGMKSRCHLESKINTWWNYDVNEINEIMFSGNSLVDFLSTQALSLSLSGLPWTEGNMGL